MQGPAPVLWTRRPSTGADRPARLRIHAARGLLTAIASAPLFECRDRASPARPPASVATDLVLAWDEQKRRRGASQTAAPAGHCTSRCSSPRARRVLTGALRGEATAASGGALFAQTRSRGCQQARAVTPALRWTGSEQQSEPLASRCPFATPGPVAAACCLRAERSSDPGRRESTHRTCDPFRAQSPGPPSRSRTTASSPRSSQPQPLDAWHCASGLGGASERRPPRVQSCGQHREATIDVIQMSRGCRITPSPGLAVESDELAFGGVNRRGCLFRPRPR